MRERNYMPLNNNKNEHTFKISLIGRTNVGKSTLFNRLSRSRSALTFDRPGVTRDTKESEIEVFDKKVKLIDSPGMFDYDECENNPLLMDAINNKLEEVILESDLILFVIDGLYGITEYDRDIANILRKLSKNVIVVTNKTEKRISENSYIESMEFGFKDNIKISAEHGLGIDELLESIYKYIPDSFKVDFKDLQDEDEDFEVEDRKKDIIRLAIIGRPNVGKSTIVNMLLGENKRLVADFAGVTRESSEDDFYFSGRHIKLIDTPGVRRRTKIYDILEKISVSNTMKSTRNADVVILVIDGSSLICGEIEKQDITLASNVIREAKALVIAFNKCDKTPYSKDEIPTFLKRNIAHSLSQLKDVPFLFICALDGSNIKKMMNTAIKAYDKQSKRVKVSDLNNWMREINNSDFLSAGSIRFKMKYIMQVGGIPPKFLIFVNNKQNMRDSHKRYITNSLKETFDMREVPIQIFFRENDKKEKNNKK